MRYVLINYDSIPKMVLSGISKVKDAKIIICYSNVDSIPISIGLELKQIKDKIEFIQIEQATIAKINFNISLYMGYLLTLEDLTDIVIISGDTQCISAIKATDINRVKLCRTIQCLLKEYYVDLHNTDELFFEKDLCKLTEDVSKKTDLHHIINDILKKQDLTHVTGNSSGILNIFIKTKNLDEFREMLIDYSYRDGIKIYDALKQLFIHVRNTGKI